MKMAIYFDGGCWPNPGPAACAAVVVNEHGEFLVDRKKSLGEKTNNEAEYHGLILAAGQARFCGATEAHFISDSELVVRQIQSWYAIRGAELSRLHSLAMGTMMEIPFWSITHVPRERNVYADMLCNQILRPDDKRANPKADFAVKYHEGMTLQPGWPSRERAKKR